MQKNIRFPKFAYDCISLLCGWFMVKLQKGAKIVLNIFDHATRNREGIIEISYLESGDWGDYLCPRLYSSIVKVSSKNNYIYSVSERISHSEHFLKICKALGIKSSKSTLKK